MLELQKKEQKDAKKKKSEEHNEDKSKKDTFSMLELQKKEKQDAKKKKSGEHNDYKSRKDTFNMLELQKKEKEGVKKKKFEEHNEGKPELNRVTCEDSLSDNFDRILKDSNANYGSKLWRRDEKDGNYCIMKGIPRSIKFRSINNLYKCTNRISPVDDEYTWNLSSDEDSIMILSIKEEPSIKTDEDNVGCKRKWREN
ncbi:hypothetical protein H5410_016132 [Solanum commersonii]|uniref:Uncharacterized protein n=1 Tax=Solanum commersonii TaxID=4109 RepID=A0A9J5ZWF2_SOLCO|nr:hypothetical protein H5410_016132 [Solanum commersonii]